MNGLKLEIRCNADVFSEVLGTFENVDAFLLLLRCLDLARETCASFSKEAMQLCLVAT